MHTHIPARALALILFLEIISVDWIIYRDMFQIWLQDIFFLRSKFSSTFKITGASRAMLFVHESEEIYILGSAIFQW